MTNQQNNDFEANRNHEALETDDQDKSKGFEVTNQGQNLGGGKKQEGGQKIGQFADDAFETQTDQTISQAAPGQTTTPTNQGSSNA